MYLLNDQQIHHYVSDAPRGVYLDIEDYDPRMLQHTSYYFRLGSVIELVTQEERKLYRIDEESPFLTIEPGQYCIVKSLETFILSEKVLGIFGQVGDFVHSGLELVHSPYIDPLFHGALELGLGNRTLASVKVKFRQRIGKVTFFDISDTYPIAIREKSIIAGRFSRLRPKRDDEPVPYD
jgi:deoxycytidine triphosphate deaminase